MVSLTLVSDCLQQTAKQGEIDRENHRLAKKITEICGPEPSPTATRPLSPIPDRQTPKRSLNRAVRRQKLDKINTENAVNLFKLFLANFCRNCLLPC